MAFSLFARLSRLFSGGSASAALAAPAPVLTPKAAAPAAAAAKPATLRVRPKPASDEKVDEPELALKQILKAHVIAAVSAQPTLASTRARTLSGLQQLDQIPALKSLAAGFSRTMSRPNVTVDEVVASISKDQALSVRILRMANSVDVSSEQRIDRLDVAVQMLGIERVRKAADAVFILNTAGNPNEALDWRHLWIHALGTAAIAEKLENLVRGEDSSTVYVAGLLHDVGKIVLSTLAPEDYKAILLDAWNESGRLEALEFARLGVDHGEAGVAFARQNKMGETIVQVIQHHGQPKRAETHRFEVALVSVANYLAKAYGLGFSGSRLGDADGEFDELAAWDVIAEETGRRPDIAELEQQMQVFVRRLRSDLAALREI